MAFNSNQAWQDAVSAVSANRDVLFPVAGVFFLIPAVAQSFFLSDIQAQIFANIGNPEGMPELTTAQTGSVIGLGIVAFVAQLLGYLALLALLTDRSRPTVGEALGIGLKSLPTLIAAAGLFLLGYIVAAGIVVGAGGGLAALVGAPAIAAVFVLMFVVALVYAVIKLSLTLPVVLIERNMNPIAAMQRSWRLTKGSSVRLGLFYLLLMIVYVVVALVVGMVLMGIASLLSSIETVQLLVAGVVSGVIGAVAGVLFAAILAAIHRQLAGDSPEAVSETFD